MKADRGLVKDIEHIDQRGTQDGCQRDSPLFPLAECPKRPLERQIAEADLVEIGESVFDLKKDRLADGTFIVGQLDIPKNCAASVIDISDSSLMFFPPIVTASASGRSRAEPQRGQAR